LTKQMIVQLQKEHLNILGHTYSVGVKI